MKIDYYGCYLITIAVSYYIRELSSVFTMEFSGFTMIIENHTINYGTDYKGMLFVKLGRDKVYIDVFGYKPLSVILPFSDLMKNDCLKTYYELSRIAIGKPNIERDYCESDDLNHIPIIDKKELSVYADTIYIIEDCLTHTRVAKKGNCYYSLNNHIFRNMEVSTDEEIEEFFVKYNKKYGFDEIKETYKALVNNL